MISWLTAPLLSVSPTGYGSKVIDGDQLSIQGFNDFVCFLKELLRFRYLPEGLRHGVGVFEKAFKTKFSCVSKEMFHECKCCQKIEPLVFFFSSCSSSQQGVEDFQALLEGFPGSSIQKDPRVWKIGNLLCIYCVIHSNTQ